MPRNIVPMLAKLTKLPSPDNEYAFEIKWDGIRAIIYCDQGRTTLQSRNLLDLTYQYPELHPVCEQLRARSAVLDGEIVALTDKGVPSFELLQNRMHLAPGLVSSRARRIPATLMIFDLLYYDGHILFDLPYVERRKALESLKLSGPCWQTPANHVGDGAALLEATRVQGFEGVVAKRIDSRYEPGQRTGAWCKIKNTRRQECVIAGWLPGEGWRTGRIGSLLTGYYDLSPLEAKRQRRPQKLVFSGKVGTGFNEATLVKLLKLLQPLQRENNPFDIDPPRYRNAFYAEPSLVGEFEFTEWTKQHIMRHPSFKGLRPDKNPRDVVREFISTP
jgi:bifunctional non-homologous end joining protein LigD